MSSDEWKEGYSTGWNDAYAEAKIEERKRCMTILSKHNCPIGYECEICMKLVLIEAGTD